MKIDIPFLMFFSFVISAITSIIFSLQFLIIKSSYRESFSYWLMGSIFNLLGMMFNYLRVMPNLSFVSIIGNNIFFILGAFSIYIGARKVRIQYSIKFWHFFYISIFLLLIFYYTVIYEKLNIRIFINSIFIAFIHFGTMYEFYKNKKTSVLITNIFLALIFFSYGIFDIIRGVYYLGQNNINFLNGSFMQISTYYMYIAGNILYTFGFIINLNQKLNEENKETNKNLDIIFETTPDSVIVTTLEKGNFVAFNEEFLKEMYFSKQELLGKSILDLGIWQNPKERDIFINKISEDGQVKNMEVIFVRKNKSFLSGLISSKLIKLNGSPHIISIIKNIEDRKIVETKLKENEEFLSAVVENNGALIYVKDMEGRYKLVNKKWEDITGLNRQVAIGKKDVELFPKEVGQKFHEMDMTVIFSGKVEEKEEELVDSKETRYFLSIKFPIKDSNKNIAGVCGLSTDITQRKKHEVQIEELIQQLEIERNFAQLEAITDGLTGLFNRRYFDNVIRREFYRLKRIGEPLSLIMIDIDCFKSYNDTYGHTQGDTCLKTVAHIIKKNVTRTTDVVARYGGEEFVVILPDTNENGAVFIAESIRKAVEEKAIEHVGSPTNSILTISLGVTTALKLVAQSPTQIIKVADDALYQAKKNGRNRVEKSAIKYLGNKNNQFSELIWNKYDESGNPDIDNEHKSLMALANVLIHSVNENKGKKIYLLIVRELLNEVALHFVNEEQVLKSTKFSGIELHKICHSDLLTKATDLLNKFEKDEIDIVDIISYITYDVIAQHMEIEDKNYFPYLKN